MSAPVSVQILEDGVVLMRFSEAFATRANGGRIEQMYGRIGLSVPSLEVAETLRDALSALITFQRNLPALDDLEQAYDPMAAGKLRSPARRA